MTLIGLVVFILVLALILYLVNLLPIDGNFKRIVQVLVIVIAIIYLLGALGVLSAGPIVTLRR